MKYFLIIQGNNSPEFLERILRICRHRGFTVQNLNAETTQNEESLHITITVCSERPINLLTKQLEKTFGVSQVVILTQNIKIQASA
ncbi:acetolactate synthase 2 small subunit [Psychromonas sp. MME2]|uniref:acetolactate synthase 2 small subunit n=1 Tax=unclassified Psychromonas TaxID=2614957 RepID=UPI00339CA305